MSLFPGYVFCLVPESREAWMNRNQYAANVLKVVSEEDLINQLVQVDRALQSGADVEVFSYLVKGTPVRIRSGPMKGLEGVIESAEKGHQVVLNVDMIQQSVAMKIDRSLIEPVI